MKDPTKKGGIGGGYKGYTFRRYAGGSAEPARLDHADDNALSDPAFYLRYLDRGSGEAR